MTDFKDGIYKGISRVDYDSIPAVNQSLLKKFDKSAAHAKEYMLHPPKPTKALDLGNAVHTAILEPARFASEYITAPNIGNRSNADKEARANFEAANRGKEIISADDMELCNLLREACYGDELISQLLNGKGTNEAGVVWTDGRTGLRCKALLDRVTSLVGFTVVVDIKTTIDASPREFAKTIANYGYHEQAAFYLEGLNALAPMPRRFFIIAVEKVAPYCVAVYELDDESLRQGKACWRQHLDTYAQCQKTGNWSGYPSGITPISIPAWAMNGGLDVSNGLD